MGVKGQIKKPPDTSRNKRTNTASLRKARPRKLLVHSTTAIHPTETLFVEQSQTPKVLFLQSRA